MGAKIERDGRFEFPNVAPGEYVLQASRHRSAGWTEGESSSQFVTVNGVDVTDLEIRTATGSTLDGHITLEGGGTFRPGQLNVSPVPVDSDLSPMIGGGPAHATVEEDLRFHRCRADRSTARPRHPRAIGVDASGDSPQRRRHHRYAASVRQARSISH